MTSKTITVLAAALLAAAVSTVSRADTFGSGNNTFTMDFVEIGNAGNSADGTGYGAVNSVFKMAVHAVSQDMVTVANTLGSLGITQDSRSTGMPSTMVNWNEAARFVNWLNTSSGYSAAYKFSTQPGDPGYSASEDISLWDSGDDGYDATNLFRNANAHYFLPSENEWYKAAY